MTAGVRFSLGTFAFDGEAAPYLVIDERAHDLRPLLGEGTTLRDLVDDWDAPAFDPSFEVDPLESFEPEVTRVFSNPKAMI